MQSTEISYWTLSEKFEERLKKTIEHNNIDINLNKKDLKRIPHGNGLGQGDPLSALLYNIAMIPLILALKQPKKNDPIKITPVMKPKGPTINTQQEITVSKIVNYADDNISILKEIDEIPSILKHMPTSKQLQI